MTADEMVSLLDGGVSPIGMMGYTAPCDESVSKIKKGVYWEFLHSSNLMKEQTCIYLNI